MPNTVQLKRSSTANSVPSAGNLVAGELAINYTDGNLFYKNASNVVTVIASNKFSSVTGNVDAGNIRTAGLVTATGNITGGNLLTGGLISAAGNIIGGNLGIGATSIPSYTRLQVTGTAGAQTDAKQQITISAPTTTVGEGAGIRFNAASGAKEAVGVIGVVNNASGNLGSMTFGVYNGGATVPEYMRLDSSGNFGIGTTSPSTGKFSDASYAFLIQSASTSTGTNIFSSNSDNSKFVGLWSGHSGATSSIGVKSGTALAFGAWSAISGSGGFTTNMTLDSGANLSVVGDVIGYASSDKKFKTNIRPIPNALSAVEHIGGKLFDWTDEYMESVGNADGYFRQKEDFGIVAQDVQKVFPLAVRTRPDGSLAVDYVKLSALAFASIAELSAKLKDLEGKINDLTSRT